MHDHKHAHDQDRPHGHAPHAHDHIPAPAAPFPGQAPCCCGGSCQSAPPEPAAPREDAPIGPAARQDVFRIEAMDCPMEEAMIRKALGGMPGVVGLRFNLLARELTVHHDLPDTIGIVAAIAALGMEAEPVTAGGPPRLEANSAGPWVTPVQGAALAVAVAAEVADWLQFATPWLPLACAVAAMLACALPIYKKGWIALTRRELNINALMSIAATGALLLGQFPEAAMVMVLFAIAEQLESVSLTRAQQAVSSLLALAPDEATVRQPDGSFAVTPAKDVSMGAVIRLRPGERVPLDGVVTAGRSSMDQSPITGESLPVEKGPGDQLFAGAINQEGELVFTSTALADNSTLARITRAVIASPGKEATTKRFVDKFAAIYTPAVFVAAVALAVVPPLVWGGGFADWIYKGLVILVIACPCALVISTPVSVVSGLAAAARRGILVKGGLFLEQGHAIKVVALDKTGTVTTGRPVQTDFDSLAGDAADNRAVAASLAARSDHPVSRAVARAAGDDGITPRHVTDFTALPGLGVRGVVDGRTYHLGNHRLIERLGLCSPAIEERLTGLERAGKTTVLLADDTAVRAIFAAADALRPHSREAVAALSDLGVSTLLLSGDNTQTATAIAAEAGIDTARGDQLPEDKARVVESLRQDHGGKGLVAMVGDGINDAPALARADIGFAMGAAGADAAIETADVAIMDDDPRKLAAFIRLSRATVAVLRQNITLALGLKALVLGLTVAGYGSMLLAVFADMGTSLLVIGNGLRLLRR